MNLISVFHKKIKNLRLFILFIKNVNKIVTNNFVIKKSYLRIREDFFFIVTKKTIRNFCRNLYNFLLKKKNVKSLRFYLNFVFFFQYKKFKNLNFKIFYKQVCLNFIYYFNCLNFILEFKTKNNKKKMEVENYILNINDFVFLNSLFFFNIKNFLGFFSKKRIKKQFFVLKFSWILFILLKNFCSQYIILNFYKFKFIYYKKFNIIYLNITSFIYKSNINLLKLKKINLCMFFYLFHSPFFFTSWLYSIKKKVIDKVTKNIFVKNINESFIFPFVSVLKLKNIFSTLYYKFFFFIQKLKKVIKLKENIKIFFFNFHFFFKYKLEKKLFYMQRRINYYFIVYFLLQNKNSVFDLLNIINLKLKDYLINISKIFFLFKEWKLFNKKGLIFFKDNIIKDFFLYDLHFKFDTRAFNSKRKKISKKKMYEFYKNKFLNFLKSKKIRFSNKVIYKILKKKNSSSVLNLNQKKVELKLVKKLKIKNISKLENIFEKNDLYKKNYFQVFLENLNLKNKYNKIVIKNFVLRINENELLKRIYSLVFFFR